MELKLSTSNIPTLTFLWFAGVINSGGFELHSGSNESKLPVLEDDLPQNFAICAPV